MSLSYDHGASSERRKRSHDRASSQHSDYYASSETRGPPPYYGDSEYLYKSNSYDLVDKKYNPIEPHLSDTYLPDQDGEDSIHSCRKSNSSTVDILIPTIIGSVLTGGLGGVGLQFLLAAVRVATLGLYAAGAGATVIGTGYVVLQGGRLFISQTRPGIIGTLRAYNRVVSDVQNATATANQTVMNTTTAAAHAVQSRLTSQAQRINLVSDQAIHQMVNGLNQLSNMPMQLQNRLMATVSSQFSREIQPQVTGVAGERPTEEPIQIWMEELEDNMVELTMMAQNGDLGERVEIALSTDSSLPAGPTLDQLIPRSTSLDLMDADIVDAPEGDTSLAIAPASGEDHENTRDDFSFVSAPPSLSISEEDGDFEIVQL